MPAMQNPSSKNLLRPSMGSERRAGGAQQTSNPRGAQGKAWLAMEEKEGGASKVGGRRKDRPATDGKVVECNN